MALCLAAANDAPRQDPQRDALRRRVRLARDMTKLAQQRLDQAQAELAAYDGAPAPVAQGEAS